MNIQSIRDNFRPSVLVPSITAGLINAIIAISVEISFAALIFSGDLSPFLARGIGLILFGTFSISIIIALTSSLAGMVGVPQDTPAALMALVSAAVAVALKGRDPESIYATVVAAIMFASVLTGALFILLGWLKLSGFARYVPYPVVGGFLAGTGYLLAKGAFGVMVDLPLSFSSLSAFFASDILWRWLPGVLFGTILFVILRRFNHFLIMPGAVLAGILLFYAYLFATGVSVQQASANGWMLGPFPEGGLFQILTPGQFAKVEWSVIFSQFSTFATLFGLSIISLLLNASGLEMIYKKDIDLDRELVSAGIANLAGGVLGSVAGYQTLGFSVLANRFGVKSRMVGIFTGLFCGLVLFWGASVISYFPKVILGGMLFLLGISFLTEWLLDSISTLPRMDYALIWVMLFIIANGGFLYAIGAGIVMSALLFVVSYSRLGVIKHILSGRSFHSQIERSQKHETILAEKGGQIHILRLQGFIFFGSIQQILENIRSRIASRGKTPFKYLVLDFQHVRRLDSSAVFGMKRLKQLTDANDIAMVWAHLDSEVQSQMERTKLIDKESDSFSIQSNLDYAVEWCENRLLKKEAEETKVDFVQNVQSYLSYSFPGLKRTKDYMIREEIQPGQYFIQQGDASNDLFFIESGLVIVEFETEDHEKIRLRSVKSGATIGEVALYRGGVRSASVKAEKLSVVYRLTAHTFRKMQKEDPQLAASLHEWLARMMAERLVGNNQMIELLMK